MQIRADIVNDPIDLLPVYIFRVVSHTLLIPAAKIIILNELSIVQSRQFANLFNTSFQYEDIFLIMPGEIMQNAIVRAVSGDRTACPAIPEEIKNFDFDRQLKPEQVFQVVDADPSQQEAILCAKKGVSFVLQGPPGTGKSQTITNIYNNNNGQKPIKN